MNDFNKIKQGLLPQLVQAEKLRKKYRLYKVISYLGLAMIILMPILISLMPGLINIGKWSSKIHQNGSGLSFQAIIIVCWILLCALFIIFNRQKANYQKIGREIIKHIFRTIAPNFSYDEMRQITSEEITESQLMPTYSQLPQYKNKYQNAYNSGIGTVSGKIGDTNMTLGDVKIINQSFLGSFYMYIPLIPHLYVAYNYIRPLFSKNHSVDNAAYSFSGILAIVDFNKKFSGTTMVLPDQLEKRIGYLAKTIQSLNFSRDEPVNLENPDFENEFVVYSTDQVEARYILSVSFMERILALKHKMDKPLMLSFKNDKLHIAVQRPYGFFSLPDNKNLITSNTLEELYVDISAAIGMVEDLNLNVRIWV